MSQKEHDASNYSDSDNEKKEKSQDLVKYSKKNIFLYDKKCRTVLHLGVLYKNLTKSAANSINLDKITSKIQKMIDKNQIYLRDAGPIILGITKIVVKKTFILFEDLEELTKLRINSKIIEQNKIINKDIKEDIEGNDDSKKKNEIKKDKQILGNEIKESNSTNPININSLDDDIFNYRKSQIIEFENSILRNKKINNKYSDLTLGKDIIELNNDNMIRRTIQKISRLNNSDIKNMISTDKKNNKKDIKFDSENKNSKTLQNLREMLLNKNNNINNNIINNFNNENNLDNNNKDVEGFFTVIKSQIEEPNNNVEDGKKRKNRIDEILNYDENDINFDFQINMDSLQNDNFNSNIKYKINNEDDFINNNLKSNKNRKTLFMLKGKLKYDEDFEIQIDSSTEKLNNKQQKEIEKNIEKENKLKIENLQLNYNIYFFDKNKLTSFNKEKYEYLLPKFLEDEELETYIGKKDDEEGSEIKGIRKEESIEVSASKINILNNSENNEKNDISRLNRLTTSNKKKISLGNFDSIENKALLQNLSRMNLDKNDFKGSSSFIEKIKAIDNENNNRNNDINRKEKNENSNFNELDLIEQDNDNDNFEEKKNFKNNNNDESKYITEDLKEEEDVIQLKEDLKKNVLKDKKSINFNKIRDKLENKDKFIESKLFYDLLLLAQKGDIEMIQKKLMNNESININLKNYN